MSNFLIIAFLALTLCFGFSQLSMAVCFEGPPDRFTCDTNPPNPDPNGIQQFGNNNDLTVTVLPGAGIELMQDLEGIITGNGDDNILVEDGSVIGGDEGIEVRGGHDLVSIINSEVISLTDNALDTGNGEDIVNISNSVLRSEVTFSVIETLGGNDTVTITNSKLLGPGNDILDTASNDDVITVSNSELIVTSTDFVGSGIRSGTGNDNVFVEDSILQGAVTDNSVVDAFDLASGNDTLTLGNGVDLRGLAPGNVMTTGRIDCGPDFDTLVFAMEVTENLFLIAREIERADPSGGSIIINGFTYEWVNCEVLVDDLQGDRRPLRPIPTLSEWGMIAMAGVIGIVAVMFVVRRRKAEPV